jgi:hypothetical protein
MAFGLGIFSRALFDKKSNIQIKGFEIDHLFVENCNKNT